jgi:hypothetical protein
LPPSYGDSSGPAVDEWFDGSEVRSTVDGFVWDRDAGRMWARERSDLGRARIRTAVPREGRKGGRWTEGDAPLSVPCMCARLSPRTSTVTPDLVSD